jgi:penicillin G amidase
LHLSRALRYLNWLIGIALFVVAGLVLWYGWRPLPKTSGSIEAPLSAPASVTRDSLGVPHIRAASLEDALFLQGFVTAQDRMWQMDVMRRHASGTLSEVIGPATLEQDRTARRMRIRRIAETVAAGLPPEDRKWAAAYARGVNWYLETHRDKLPAEFAALSYDPRPWTIADTIAIGLDMHRDLTSSYRPEIARAAMFAGADPNLLRQLFPPRSGLELQPGSNAWVISGRHTATGKPILANDPHLQFGLPSTWYANHLQAPGLNVTGVSLPGVPAVIIGHNEHIAWGVTNLHFDVQDLYIERLDSRTGQYLHKGQLMQAVPEREVIVVRGAAPVEFNNWVTLHGPVWSTAGMQSIAMRWIAAEPGMVQLPFLEVNRARDWASFRSALSRFPGPAQNFVYADVDGNIGYQVSGVLPIRNGYRADVPVDGTSGQFEWAGFIPFDDLPSVYNPPSGRLITANQNPFPPDWKYSVSGEFDSGYRARQIQAMLSARGSWKPEEMLAIQKDVYSPYLHFIAQQAVKAKGADAAGVALLSKWNGQMERDLAAPVLAVLLNEELRLEIGKRAVGRTVPPDAPFTAAAVERLLRTRPREWFPDWDAVIVRALSAALAEGRRMQGRNPEKWRYGATLRVELKHPVFSRIPWIGPYFGTGEQMMSGASTTVKQTTSRLGPSMRFVADLSDWNKSLNNLTLGQSGHVLSSHFKDQWQAYLVGTSFPMQWTPSGGDVLEVRPVSAN